MKQKPHSQPVDAPATGPDRIESYLRSLPSAPGVYRMVNAAGDVLYVGKAKNLKKRVASYANSSRLGVRIRRMVSETAAMEFVTTHTEAEALLLEANFIKKLRPRYNILLRDDKSFPSILVTAGHEFPQVLKYRGAQTRIGDYFGPFASAWAVNKTLAVLQRAFLLRVCSDLVFAARTRPCLLYQIKRCSAPCVGRISGDEYAELVAEARAFLNGESQRVQQHLASRMEAASEALDFESAAVYRDRIRALTAVQSHQDINLQGLGEADVIAGHQVGGHTCVQVFFFRAGGNYGNRAYYPDHGRDDSVDVVLEAFIGQFYATHRPPPLILLSGRLPNKSLIEEALSVRADRKVRIALPQRGEKKSLVEHALTNAREALSRRMTESTLQRRLLEDLARRLDLDGPPGRIEVYDNSHASGSSAVGAMIAAGPDGFIKSGYRKFNMRGEDPTASSGDDYAMMREMLTRRFSRALKEDPDRARDQWPQLVLIDGGAGHLGIAVQVLEDLGIDDIAVAAIAKGPDRNAGRERIFLPGRQPISFDSRDPVLYFLQRLRDEAHRFAIGTHRARRSRKIKQSPLDEIPGIGARRKKSLLHHFGSVRSIEQAGRADLAAVDGISQSMANKIYEWFHTER